MVVRQYDVYIEDIPSREGDDRLVVAQFPALQSQLSNTADEIQFYVKPKSMKLKFDVDLNHHSRSYSSGRAESLAEKSKPQAFPDGRVNKNTYTSTRNDLNDSQMFVAKVVDQRLICRPITDFVSFRSDLTHLDIKEETDPKEEVRPVSVKFAASDRQSLPIRPKESQQEIEEALEDYKSFTFRDIQSSEAKLLREHLFYVVSTQVKIKPDPEAMPQYEQKPVIDIQDCDIKPKIETMEVDDIYSIGDIRNRPGSPSKISLVRSRVKECLMKAKIVSFEEVYSYLLEYRDLSPVKSQDDRTAVNVKDLIDSLSEHAVLVQGNWAIKSETLYGDSSVKDSTDVTGIPINHFIAARDYLLWLFNQDRLVSRPLFTKHVKIPDHDALQLFNELGRLKANERKWELKLPTDEKFISKFPEVVQRQNTFWKVRKANKLNTFFKS